MEVLIGIGGGGGGGVGMGIVGGEGGVIGGDGKGNEMSGSSNIDAVVDELEKYCQFLVEVGVDEV